MAMAKMGGQVAYDVIYSGKGVEKKNHPQAMFTKQKQHKYDLIVLTFLLKLFRIEIHSVNILTKISLK